MADYDLDVTSDSETEPGGKSETVTRALKRLAFAQATRARQLKREQAALRFQVPELQWDDDARAARAGSKAEDGSALVPAQPTLSIPKTNQPVQLILNQEKAAHLGVKVGPLTEDADDDTAEVMRDLYRREEQRGGAGTARSWAFDRAVKSGFGAYRIDTEYDDESSNPFDQRIVWRRLLHQDAVWFDPGAQEPDWSDGEWAFEGPTWVRLSKLKRQFPESELAGCDDDDIASMAETEPEWVRLAGEHDEPLVAVVVYWRKEFRTRTWVVLDDGSFAYEDEIPEGRRLHPDPKVARTRSVEVPTVIRSILTATEELHDPEEWNGKYIPLVPVVGVELQPFDGERRWQGVIEPAMDAQKMFNYAASSAVELAASETKSPYIMWEGQDEGYEEMWRQSAVRKFPALKAKPVYAPNGELLPRPERTQIDVSRLGPSMMLLEQADQFIQAATTTLDQTRIEQMGKRRVAHQTINALQEQSDFGNSHYLHNLATISMPYEAKVVIDLMARIYDRPGRLARLLDLEDDERSVLLNTPFITDPKTKRPIPAPPTADPSKVKRYNLQQGRYGVSVDVGKSWKDRVQQGAEEIGTILTANPELMPLIGPTYFKFRDFPGSKEIGEVLKKVRAQTHPGLEDEDDPAAAQAKAQALEQENMLLKQQLQAAAQALETDQAKQQAQIAKARMDNSTKVQVEREENQTAIVLQEMKQMFEAGMARMEQAHERQMAAHQAKMAQAQAEQGHLHQIEQKAVDVGAGA